MNTKSLVIGGVVGIIIGVLVYPALFSQNKSVQTKIMASRVDNHFIEQMIPHHEGAIDMAKVALEKAKHPELKTLAQNIIAAQTKEIGDMKGWYKTWFGVDVPAGTGHMMNGQMMGGSMMHMGSMAGDMDTLKNAKDFDLEFIRQMIPHHELAVMMAQMLQGTTDRPEMKQLAQNIIDSQTKEIEMMRGWMIAWSK